MSTLVALLRGINVGGNNLIPMADLRACFSELGAAHVATYIQSGNVVFDGGSRSLDAWTTTIEAALSDRFGYKARIVLRSHAELRTVVDDAPTGFGAEPDAYRYDVVFLKEPLAAAEALPQIPLKDGVDEAWAGDGVLYHARLNERATESKMSRIVAMPMYQLMTIRNWRTTTKLLEMCEARGG